ncbi:MULTISPECIES: hypothetical protein [Gammaproteobacteria]|uniref:hypothetical protein n=1 Tax=Gammaproteobacteria TaxID=1236 RepID=UPI000DCF8BE1|nr:MULTISPECIES: hypothetical protein [Gammaproteobacteria]RTE87275.1 hypothetical protein DQX04_02485 [Aliidiomarina sp. B3213]TCZ92938.1 hypothetical protein EYQ95_02820 [Lysobacter sp. N42]
MAEVNLPWLSPLWMQWVQAKHGKGLPHAIGVPWQPDAGSQRITQALVAWLMCQEDGNSACGRCKSCLLFEAGNHPDFLRVTPEDDKKIGVDVIRKMQERVWARANQSGCKVIWIEHAEKMTEAAANALLKVLEEPPEKTYLIVSPERFSRLLPTIRSRLTLFSLPKPSLEELHDWLKAHSGIKQTDSDTLTYAQSRPLKALADLQSSNLEATNALQQLLAGQLPEFPDKGEELEQWLDDFLLSLQKKIRTQTLEQASVEPELLSWYNQVLELKKQNQSGGMNMNTLIHSLFSDIAVKSFQ